MWAAIFKDLCEPHHLIIVVLVLIIAVLLGATGKGLGGAVNAIIKRFGGKETNVIHIGGGAVADRKIPKECEGCGLMVDPSKCIMHQSEHERSLRNETQIAALWEEYGKLRNENLAAATKLREDMGRGFEKVNTAINTSNTAILSALAGGRNGFRGPGRGGGEE